MMSSDSILKTSCGIMHVFALMLVAAVLLGRESSIIGDMFSGTLAAIAANLAIISGNKALQKFADRMAGTTTESTVITKTKTEPTPDATASPQ